jgi:hypothetical protein
MVVAWSLKPSPKKPGYNNVTRIGLEGIEEKSEQGSRITELECDLSKE